MSWFATDRGSSSGFVYRASLKSDATAALKHVAGVDEIVNKIEVLPASQNDDRIRWATFYNIYTDDFLSRYTPGGAISARYEARSFAASQACSRSERIHPHHRQERPNHVVGSC